MAVTINGTTGITTPGDTNTGNEAITGTLSVGGATTLTGNVTLGTSLLATPSGSAPSYLCRAWVNWDGTTASPSTIRASGNVTSVTKTGTGIFTINLTTALTDASYSICGTAGKGVGFVSPRIIGVGSVNPTASAAQVTSIDDSGANNDCQYSMVAIFR